MNLTPGYKPWSVDGDELLDAHNAILLKFAANIDPKAKEIIVAAPNMEEWIRKILDKIRIEIDWANERAQPFELDDAFYEICNEGEKLLNRIENARLIAAAPDMLELLRFTLSYLQSSGNRAKGLQKRIKSLLESIGED